MNDKKLLEKQNKIMKKALEEISKGGYIGEVISIADRALEEINP